MQRQANFCRAVEEFEGFLKGFPAKSAEDVRAALSVFSVRYPEMIHLVENEQKLHEGVLSRAAGTLREVRSNRGEWRVVMFTSGGGLRRVYFEKL